MKKKNFNITIEGCWNDGSNNDLPDYPGLFFVFEAKKKKGNIYLLRLIYVGEADNVREGISGFRKKFDFFAHIRQGNKICYQVARIDGSDREKIWAAYVYIQKPPANDKYKYIFPFASTRIIAEGKTGFLKHDFTL